MNGLTVNDYLDNLELDRQDMINSLKSKGVELSDSATFTELVPKIDGLVDINGYYDTNVKRTSGSISYYIKQIPMIDTSGYTSTNYMFSNYSSLTTIPQLDTSKVTKMSNMFDGCTSLTTIPLLNTSNVTNMNNMFSECTRLTSIPELDTSSVTTMNMIFYKCSSLTTIPQLDTSKVTNMRYMFDGCTSLTTIPLLDTSNVTDMGYMFADCKNLTTIPQLDTSKVTNMNAMFYNTFNLTTVPQLNASSVNYISGIFTNLRNILNIGGFKDLGKGYDTTKSANYSDYKLDLSRLEQLTEQSLINVLNNLYDIATKGCQPQQLKLGSTNLAKLTEEEIAIATNKGWNVVA